MAANIELNGYETLAELKEIVKGNPVVFAGIVLRGKGRTKAVIAWDIHQALKIHTLQTDVESLEDDNVGLRKRVESLEDKAKCSDKRDRISEEDSGAGVDGNRDADGLEHRALEYCELFGGFLVCFGVIFFVYLPRLDRDSFL